MYNQPETLGPITDYQLAYIAAATSARKSRPGAMDFAKVDSEIRGGLKNEKVRLSGAWKNRQWFEGNIKPFLSAMAMELGLREGTVRTTNIMKSWIDILTKYLYAGGPERTVPDNPELSEYLAKSYAASNFDSVMTQACQYAIVSGVAAIQIEINEAETDEETTSFLTMARPAVSHRVWPADQFVVWVHPDKPLLPWCVAIIDYYDNRRRLRAWTSEKLVTYETKKYNADNPWDGNSYNLVSEEKNFLGVVPFAFVWHEQPTSEFWTPSPGDSMQMFQEALTARLWKQNDDILYQRPILQGRNLRSDVKIPDKYQAGDLIRMAPVMDQLGDGPEPTIEYAYCDLSYLQLDREQLDYDMTMYADSIGIPEAAWRLKGQSAASGVAIVSEQLPVIEAAERRQLVLQRYERDVAMVTLVVANAYLGGVPMIDTAMNADFDLAINWGSVVKSRPGSENDQHLQFLLINGLESKAGVLADLHGITLDQAREKLAQIQEDTTVEAEHAKSIQDISQPPDEMMGGGFGGDQSGANLSGAGAKEDEEGDEE